MTALLLAAVGGTGRETSLYFVRILLRCDIYRPCDQEIRGRVAGTTETGLAYVALAADGLLAVVLGGKGLEGRLDNTTTETQDKVKGGLL